MAVTYGLMTAFGLSSIALALNASDALVNTAISLVIAWLIAVFLLALNRPLYMLLEGYGRFNPAALLSGREKARFRKLISEKEKLEQSYWREANNTSKQEDILSRLGQINEDLAMKFPDKEDLVLPTRFGNTLRA